MELKSLIPVGRDRNVARREWNPFDTLQREIDRLFDDFGRGSPGLHAPNLTSTIDVTETDKEIEITAELPGLEEKDVEVNVADNVLTIRGEKKAEKEEEGKNYQIVEHIYGAFARAAELPDGVDADAIKASIAKRAQGDGGQARARERQEGRDQDRRLIRDGQGALRGQRRGACCSFR
jgi:HSP20 family protein